MRQKHDSCKPHAPARTKINRWTSFFGVMATDLQSDYQTWRLSPDTLPPTSLAEGSLDALPDTHTNMAGKDDSRSGQIGERGATNRLAVADAESAGEAFSPKRPSDVPHGEDADVNHASSHPIAVPQPQSTAMRFDEAGSLNIIGHAPCEDLSPLEEFLKNRRPSISFDPKVTLESGHQRSLDEPLPKLSINTQSRRTSLIYEARHPSRCPLQRVQSESDCRNYDPTTGEHLDSPQRQDSPNPAVDADNPPSQHPHVTTTLIDPPQQERTSSESEQGISLTSESTASPIASEVQTPTESMDLLLSPVSTFPPLAFPISLEDSSAWPKPRRQTSNSRAKSYEVERGFSMRSAQRVNSRASTRRSTSSSMSPATTFLSRFARQETLPEPDSEGQEVGEYVLGKQVGFGGFSSVREAFTIEGDERIVRAVKVVRRQILGKEETENEKLQAEFEHEVSLWRCLGHRYILPLIEVYETNFATFCFTKLNTGGTLFDVIRANRRGLGRDLARRYTYQLASAIRYLHEDVRIVHRDIKLENCLIDVSDPLAAKDGGNVLLCDFGLAEFVTHDLVRGSPDPYEQNSNRSTTPQNPCPSENSTSIAGSLQYASPELILSPAGFLSTVVDVWAFGVVTYALLVGDLPFQHTFQPRVQMMILAGEWNVEALEQAPGVTGGYEEEAVELIRGCLDMESEARWTVSEVLGSRWLQGCQEILEELNESIKL